MGGIDVGEKTVEELTIQARVEQLEGSIAEAHRWVDKMDAQSQDNSEPTAGGILHGLSRCQREMADLNRRLENLGAKVGQL